MKKLHSIFRSIFLILSMSSVALVSHVQGADGKSKQVAASAEEVVEQLLLANKVEASWDALLAGFKESQAKLVDQEKFAHVCAKYLKYSDVKPVIVSIYVRHFSKDELVALHQLSSMPELAAAMQRAHAVAKEGGDDAEQFRAGMKAGSEQERIKIDNFIKSAVWRDISTKQPEFQEDMAKIFPDILDAHREEFRSTLLN